MRISIFTLFLYLLFSSISIAAPLSIYVVSDDEFPPFSFVENGKVTGIDVDIIKEMGRRNNIDIKIDLFPWKRLIMMTKTGRCDASMSLFHSPEREKFALFTHAVHYSTFVIFVKKGKQFNYSSIDDLYGKKLAKQSGFIISDDFDMAVKSKKLEIFDIFKTRGGMKFTILGISNGFVANKHVTLYKLKNNLEFSNFKDRFVILPKPVKQKRASFFVLSKRSKINNKIQLQEQIIKTLKTMEEEGFYKKVNNKYLD
ncbi:MAG: amino acid ABC transporter substrate-binding protein [Desulfobacterales bacterium]|nr:amino acid ABC transporter substrate-binding protein [Desulfobacterales bacterium]MCP4158525.1 amino acid ABC transporter substrate-binding protein [Deltaproteobacteria bacterium]